MKDNYGKLVTSGALDKAIELALSAPAPQIAIHHLIDKVIEHLTPPPPSKGDKEKEE